MPSVEWNRRWGREFDEYSRGRKKKRYGTDWGDPSLRGLAYLLQKLRHPFQVPGRLYKVIERYIEPHITPETVVLEIGCGGGRWTQYLVGGKKLVAVDINSQFFEPLRESLPGVDLEFYQPDGCELLVVADSSIDFVFSFGTFVHIEPEGIRCYLDEIKRVLRPGGPAVIHYSEKRKWVARLYRGFSDMTAERMEDMVPMSIVEHDTGLLHHSNIIVLRK